MQKENAPVSSTITCDTPVTDAHVIVPGSKSISNRAFLIAAMAKGTSVIKDPLDSDDTKAMLSCLEKLGVAVNRLDNGDVAVTGTGAFSVPTEPLFVGNAGTTARFLIAVAALVPGAVPFDGDQYMRLRPMKAILDAIQPLGASNQSDDGLMPFTIVGNTSQHEAWAAAGQRPTVLVDPSLSSQYVSALMMIAPMLPCGLIIKTTTGGDMDAVGYLDITLDCMAAFGAKPARVEPGLWDFDPTGYTAGDFQVEPDYSGCTYFWAAQQLACPDLSIHASDPSNTTQPDAKSLDVMQTFPNMPAVIDGSQMQDSVPTLGVLAVFNNTPVRFVGIKNLRVKECDRIEAVAGGLNLLKPGLATVEGDDLVVHANGQSPELNQDVIIDSHDDHRIAMAFALVALMNRKVSVSAPRCVEKTFPNYWLEIAKCGVSASHLAD